MGISKQEFRNAMSGMGAAVAVVTTNGPGGLGGFTASAVCSLSDDPPTLLICMRTASRLNPIVKKNGSLCVNVLNGNQLTIAQAFAASNEIDDGGERFKSGRWHPLITGSPALSDALVCCDCSIAKIVEFSTHSVVFGTVRKAVVNDEYGGLIYAKREYHALPSSRKELGVF